MSPTLLIAGAGYVGAELLARAREAGWNTIGLTKSGGPGLRACDLTSKSEVQKMAASLHPQERPAVMVHCASSGRGGAAAYRAVFVDGCAKLRHAFPSAPLLFVSSSSVYGQADGSTVTEASPAVPDRETSRLLLEAEQSVLQSGGCVARLAGIYGPSRSVLLERFLSGEAGIEEDGSRILNQIHRDDAATALLHLLSLPRFPAGEIFNVADSHPRSQLECYRALAAQFHRPLPPHVPRKTDRKRAWTNKRVSNAKLRATGWEPAYPDFLPAAAAIAPTLSSTDSA